VNTSAPLPTAADIVGAAIAGDTAAFREIVVAHQNLVTGVCYAALGERTAAQDAAQEAFVVAWRRLDSLRDPDRLRPWLAGIARHVCRNRQRARHADPLHAADASPEAVDVSAGPDQQAIAREEEQIVDRTLAALPADYREVIVLYYRENQSAAEVATALELTEEAVRQRLVRGRQLLQTRVLQQVERTLRRTAPGAAFAVGVLALLPAPSASATVLGGAAVPLGASLATGTIAASLGARIGLLGAAIGFVAGFLGGWLGARAARAQARNSAQRLIVSGAVRRFGALALLYVAAICACTVNFRALYALHPTVPWLGLVGVTAVYGVLLVGFIRTTNRRFQRAAE
jgi:zinc protease